MSITTLTHTRVRQQDGTDTIGLAWTVDRFTYGGIIVVTWGGDDATAAGQHVLAPNATSCTLRGLSPAKRYSVDVQQYAPVAQGAARDVEPLTRS